MSDPRKRHAAFRMGLTLLPAARWRGACTCRWHGCRGHGGDGPWFARDNGDGFVWPIFLSLAQIVDGAVAIPLITRR